MDTTPFSWTHNLPKRKLLEVFASITWNKVFYFKSPITSSILIMPMTICPPRLKPWIIRWLRDNSSMVISNFIIVDLGTMFNVEPPSMSIRLSFYSCMNPDTKSGRLCGLDPNKRSSSVNVMEAHVAQQVAWSWALGSTLPAFIILFGSMVRFINAYTNAMCIALDSCINS